MSRRRTDFTGPALIRLLARINAAQLPESQQAFADRLSQWLGWTDAIALSAALNGVPGNAPANAPLADARSSLANAEEGECARVRDSLAQSIAQDNLFAPPRAEPVKAASRGTLYVRGAPIEAPPPPAPVVDESDFTPYRLRYQARQQAMEAGIGALRDKLRARLATRSGEPAKLAALDGVMEHVLGEQERRLLGALPSQLEKHFHRLRKEERATTVEGDEQQAPARPPEEPWLHRFGQDAQAMLLAELDIRFKPVEGLLEALRKPAPQAH